MLDPDLIDSFFENNAKEEVKIQNSENKKEKNHVTVQIWIPLLILTVTLICLCIAILIPRHVEQDVSFYNDGKGSSHDKPEAQENIGFFPNVWEQLDGIILSFVVWILSLWSLTLSLKEWQRKKGKSTWYWSYFFMTIVIIFLSLGFTLYIFAWTCIVLMRNVNPHSSETQPSYNFFLYFSAFIFLIGVDCFLIYYVIGDVLLRKKQEEQNFAKEHKVDTGDKNLMDPENINSKSKKNNENTDTLNQVINAEFLMHVLSFLIITVFFILIIVEHFHRQGVIVLLFVSVISSSWNFSTFLMAKGREEKRLKLYCPYFATTTIVLVSNGFCFGFMFIITFFRFFNNGFANSPLELFLYFCGTIVSLVLLFSIGYYGIVVIGRYFWKLVEEEKTGAALKSVMNNRKVKFLVYFLLLSFVCLTVFFCFYFYLKLGSRH